MLGRLSEQEGAEFQTFPVATWREEFERARELGLGALEWLFGLEAPAENPLFSPAGRAEIRERSAATGVRVRSVCAHHFISGALAAESEAERQAAHRLLAETRAAASDLGAEVVVLPVLEGNTLQDPRVRAGVSAALNSLGSEGAPLALETDLPAPEVAAFLAGLESPAPLGVCYDTGNATSFGFVPTLELEAIGSRVLEVHFKDRFCGGRSVSLGQGDTDFPGILAHLAAAGFAGPIVLETPAAPDWRALAEGNLAYLEGLASPEGGP